MPKSSDKSSSLKSQARDTPPSQPPLKMAVLISGGGTTLQNFIDLQARGELDIDITLVLSSQPGVKGLLRAKQAGIPTVVVQRSDSGEAGWPAEDLFSKKITEATGSAGVDLVCMAGFLSMWIVPPQFEGKVMNIHPALLPSFGGKGFYGPRVHQAVINAGCKVSGCTVHFVDNIYDHGPIILQEAVAVQDGDTPQALATRIAKLERILYPNAVRLFAEGRLRIEDRRVRILH